MNKFRYTYVIYCTAKDSSYYNCVYYGKHTTDNLLDGYIASGKLIKRYIKKYPNDYYRKILRLYNTEEELNKAEYDLIHSHLNKPYCLNLMEGGHGGELSIKSRKNLSNSLLKSEKMKRRNNSEEWHKNISIGAKKRMSKPENNPMFGVKRSEEYKINMSKIMTGKFDGEKNPMYGKSFKDYMTEEAYNQWYQTRLGKNNPMSGKHYIGITNGKDNKYIDPSEWSIYEAQGYRRGQTRNKNKIK